MQVCTFPLTSRQWKQHISITESTLQSPNCFDLVITSLSSSTSSIIYARELYGGFWKQSGHHLTRRHPWHSVPPAQFPTLLLIVYELLRPAMQNLTKNHRRNLAYKIECISLYITSGLSFTRLNSFSSRSVSQYVSKMKVTQSLCVSQRFALKVLTRSLLWTSLWQAPNSSSGTDQESSLQVLGAL